MPGVGVRTAARLLLHVGDADAFPTPGHLAAYAGLAPSPDDPEHPSAANVPSLERVTGIEPALSAWEADVLPLNYTRERRRRYPSAARCQDLNDAPMDRKPASAGAAKEVAALPAARRR
jgi:hypothetical protein